MKKTVKVGYQRAQHKCGYPLCPNLTHARYCERHEKEQPTPERKAQRRTAANDLRSTARWTRFSKWFRRRHPLCANPHKWHPELRPVEEVHHIKPVIEYPELSFDEDNCMALCSQCHGRIDG